MKWLWIAGLGLALALAVALWDPAAPEPRDLASDPGMAEGTDTSLAQATLKGRAPEAGASLVSGTRIEGTVVAGPKGVAARVELLPAPSPPSSVPVSHWWGWRRAERMITPRTLHARAIATTHSDAEGHFQFAVPAIGIYELRASSTDGRVATTQLEVKTPGQATRVRLHLPHGTPVLHGTVRDGQGRPWQGWIRAGFWERKTRDAPPGAAIVATDEHGRYEVHGPAGIEAISLRAFIPGVMMQIPRHVQLPRSLPYDFIVGGGDVSLRGRVLHDDTGEPLAGAVVIARSPRTSESRGVVTGPDGSFRMQMDQPSFILEAHKQGFASTRFGGRPLPEEILMRMRPSGILRGRVVDVATGAPVAGVPIQGFMYSGVVGGGHATTVSDPQGAFVLRDLHAGDVRIVAWGHGWVPQGATTHDSLGVFATCVPGRTVEVELPVERAGRVSGHVRDSGGRPVAQARVGVWEECRACAQGEYITPVTTDASGAYTLVDVPPCRDFHVFVESPAHADVIAGPVTVSSGETATLDVTAPPTRWCDLQVVDAEGGAPVPHARVEVRGEFRNEYRDVRRRMETDTAGRVRVGPLPPDPLKFRVTAPGYLVWPTMLRSRWAPIEGIAPTGTGTATLKMVRGKVIRGRIVREDGGRTEPGYLFVQPAHAPGWKTWQLHLRTKADGRFEAAAPPTGTFLLRAHVDDARTGRLQGQATVEAGSQGVEIRLAGTRQPPTDADEGERRAWRLRVLGPDGEPVRSVRARSIGWKGKGHTSASRQGVGEILTVPVGKDTDAMHVLILGARTADGSRLAGSAHGPWSSEGGEDVIRLPSGGVIAGRCVGDTKQGLAGIHVRLNAPNREGWPEQGRGLTLQSMRTLRDGSFRFEGLAPGVYRIGAETPYGWIGTSEQLAQPGGAELEFVYRRGVRATVTVLDPEGRPAKNAWLNADPRSPRSGRDVSATTDEAGRAVLDHLDPDTVYELEVEYEESNEVSFYREIDGWRPGDLTVRFVRTHTIAGVVTTPGGAPLGAVHVTSVDARGAWAVGTTKPDGSFRIHDRVTGAVRLWVDRRPLDVESVENRTPITAQAGDTDIRLSMEAGWVVRLVVRGTDGSYLTQRVGLRVTAPKPNTRRWRDPTVVQDGKATLAHMTAGESYQVYVGPTPDGRCAYHDGPMPASGLLTLTLAKGKTIRGRVLNEKGKPAVGSHVTVFERGVRTFARTKPDGSYEIPGLPEGTWRVSTNIRVKGRFVSKVAEVSAGGTLDFDFRR